MFAFASAPIDTHVLSPFPILPLTRSLGDNRIGDEGATKLAAILNKTKLTNLKCAATPKRSLLCQRPLTLLITSLLSRARSLRNNHIGPKGGAALADGLKGNSTLKELK